MVGNLALWLTNETKQKSDGKTFDSQPDRN